MGYQLPPKLNAQIAFKENEQTVQRLQTIAPGMPLSISARTLLRLALELLEKAAVRVETVDVSALALAFQNTLAAPRQTRQTCSPRASTAASAGIGAEPQQTGKTVAKSKGNR